MSDKMNEHPFYERLVHESGEKGLSVVIPLTGSRSQKTEKLQIEVRSGDKVIDYEVVGSTENCESAGHRLYKRMKKDKVI